MRDETEVGGEVRLSPGETHHIRRVLRAGDGERIELVDVSRRLFVAELLEGDRARVLSEVSAGGDDGGACVVLYQAVPKGRRMDLVMEKATELGVERIVPLSSDRGVVRSGVGSSKVGRWRRIAESAARQALRLKVPEVSEVMSFGEAVEEAEDGGVLLHNDPAAPPLEGMDLRSPAAVFVGPEGGWSERELSRAGEAGLSVAHLGPYRLRSETAGIAAVSRAKVLLGGYEGEAYRTECPRPGIDGADHT
nr:RsmE family RNA methyltransferase [Rubrobacter taiwanensis]